MPDTNQPQKQTLLDVIPGQYVFTDETWIECRTETLLREVTFRDAKGRLFICVPKAELVTNWRYGFSPETGKAQHYRHMVMRWASPDEIAAEKLRLRNIEREHQAKDLAEVALNRKRSAASEMYDALQAVACAFTDERLHEHSGTMMPKVWRAIKLADGGAE